MAKKNFIVYFEIGACVEFDTNAKDMTELTDDERITICNKACEIVETPNYGNIVDIMEDF